MAKSKQNSSKKQSKSTVRNRRPAQKFTRPSRSRTLAGVVSQASTRAYRRTWNQAIRTAGRRINRTTTGRDNQPSDNNGVLTRGRIVLLDACNVGYFHSNHRGFSAEGVRLALQYFFNRNMEAYGMLPKFRLKPGKSSDYGLLDMLYKNGRLITTPCKEFPVRAMCYDDRFMLEIAHRFDCAIVSNDYYRDIMHEKPEWAAVVSQRRLGFHWNGNEFVVNE